MLIDLLFTFGQTACVLLILYGGYLVIVPARRPMDEAVLVARHLQHE